MAGVIPRIRVLLTVSVFAVAGALLLALFIWRLNIPMLIAMAFFYAVLGIGLTRAISMQLSPSGISQLTLGGRREVAWSDITKVARQPQTMTLVGPRGRVIVPLILFDDADAAHDFVISHLPPHLRSR
jgi:hypothetical protein